LNPAVHNCGRTTGLTGNNLITMPKNELSLQDIATSLTECILVAWILNNMLNKKIHLESAEESQAREPLLAGKAKLTLVQPKNKYSLAQNIPCKVKFPLDGHMSNHSVTPA